MTGNVADLWIFAYGSLMWRPGFPHLERVPALLRGYHRAMCILSTRYRGDPQTPGLVLGLDRGGACRGIVYRVAADEAPAVKAYLDEREMPTRVYDPRFLPVALADGRRLAAYGFVVRRDHPQYLRPAAAEEAARLIRQGVGSQGTSRDYLANTVRELGLLGLSDRSLCRLLALVDAEGVQLCVPSP